MSLWFGYPTLNSIHQERDIPCQGGKQGRFFQGGEGFQIKFLELNNILYGMRHQLPNIYGGSTLPNNVRHREARCPCAQSDERDRHSRKWFQNPLRVLWRCQERWLFLAGVEAGHAP